MRSYDPDDESVYVEPEIDDGVQLDDDVVEIDTERALALLDRITHELPGGGESRQGQREMVRSVAAAFSRRKTTVIEAGTGIGKSLAYLIPAAMSGHRVVIATATKNLQDQLAQKDAPTVAANAAGVRVAVLKGKQNYVCRNRLHSVGGAAQLSFDDGSDVPKGVADQMRRIVQWSNETETGDRDELPFEVDQRAWRGLSVTPQECLHRVNCPQGQNCFAELAKDRAAESSILIVNTHLYASHLASGAALLPAHEFVVFDEAHEIVDIFALPTRHVIQRHATACACRRGPTVARTRVPRALSRPRRGRRSIRRVTPDPVRPQRTHRSGRRLCTRTRSCQRPCRRPRRGASLARHERRRRRGKEDPGTRVRRFISPTTSRASCTFASANSSSSPSATARSTSRSRWWTLARDSPTNFGAT